MLIIHQFTKFFGGKCGRIQTLDMNWIEIALIYCPLILISSLEQKKSNIFNVKYEIVLRTPYSKARWARRPKGSKGPSIEKSHLNEKLV